MPLAFNVTIMFTDIVGYSAMVGKDESHALKLLEEHNKTIEPVILKFNGEIIKHIGDAIFAKFKNPEDALNSSIEFQQKFRKRNSISQLKDKILVRTGIHIGEVIEKDNDLFGNSVNICSRIESISMPGGIAISSDVNQQIKGEVYNRSFGFVKLKNINNPIEIINIYLDEEDYLNESKLNFQQSIIERGINVINPQDLDVQEIISIGLMYFKNLGEEGDEYFSYGLQKQIINELKIIEDIYSPSLNESVQYKDSNLSISDIARRLKVNNILRGTILVEKEQIFIDIELISIDTGEQVNAEKFIGNKNAIGNLTYQIILFILTPFDVEIPSRILNLQKIEKSNNQEAIESYLKGFQTMELAKSNDDLLKAQELFGKAYEIDKDYIDARAQYGVISSKLGEFDEAESILKEALNIAEKKNDEDSKSVVFNLLGFIYNSWNKYEQAQSMYEKGLKIQSAIGDRVLETKMLNGIAGSFNGIGDYNSAKEYQMRSIRIKEELDDDHLLSFSYASMGNTYKIRHDISKSNEWFLKALGKFTASKNEFQKMKVLILLSSNNIELGNIESAKRYNDEAKFISRNFDDPLLLGFILVNDCKLNLLDDKTDEALDNLFDSIDNFQIVDSRTSIINSLYEVCLIYILDNEFNKLRRHLSKAIRLIKKYQVSKYALKFSILELILDITDDDIDVDRINAYKNDLGKLKSNDFYIEWWLLAKCYLELGDDKKAKSSHQKSKKQLEFFSHYNSDSEDSKSFIKYNHFSKLINSKLKPFSENSDKPKLSFCPACGQKLQESFAFCGACGQKLT
jgi:TolB-like protein/Tfp pilus assembly protein PilF